jgi:hypothetical protein
MAFYGGIKLSTIPRSSSPMIPGRAGLIGVSFALETASKSTTSKETNQHQNDLIAALVQLITLI